MDISAVFTPQSHAGVTTAPPAGQRTENPGAAFSLARAPATPDPGPAAIAAVKARYDMTHITPREVDTLVHALEDAGMPFGEELLTLLTYGEEFQSHIAKQLGVAPQPDRPMNLVDHGKAALEYARRAGDPTDHWQALLKYLDSFAPAPDSAAPLQSQVEARMQSE